MLSMYEVLSSMLNQQWMDSYIYAIWQTADGNLGKNQTAHDIEGIQGS